MDSHEIDVDRNCHFRSYKTQMCYILPYIAKQPLKWTHKSQMLTYITILRIICSDICQMFTEIAILGVIWTHVSHLLIYIAILGRRKLFYMGEGGIA